MIKLKRGDIFLYSYSGSRTIAICNNDLKDGVYNVDDLVEVGTIRQGRSSDIIMNFTLAEFDFVEKLCSIDYTLYEMIDSDEGHKEFMNKLTEIIPQYFI